jgi:hypothetical protein
MIDGLPHLTSGAGLPGQSYSIPGVGVLTPSIDRVLLVSAASVLELPSATASLKGHTTALRFCGQIQRGDLFSQTRSNAGRLACSRTGNAVVRGSRPIFSSTRWALKRGRKSANYCEPNRIR